MIAPPRAQGANTSASTSKMASGATICAPVRAATSATVLYATALGTFDGQAAHTQRMLEGLRGEGVEPPVILWALAREIRLLATIAQQYAQGMPLEKAFSSARPPVWDKRRPLVSKALQRLSASRWAALLQDAQQIDAQIKGQAPGDAWSGLSLLTLNICGQRLGLNR